MLAHEEAMVLGYLHQHRHVRAADLTTVFGAGRQCGWLDQVISQLDWLGYVTVFAGPSGEPNLLQITERGLAQVG